MFMRVFFSFFLLFFALFSSAVASDVYRARRGVNVGSLVGTKTVGPRDGPRIVFAVDNEKCGDAFAARLRRSGVELVRLVTNPLPLIEPDFRSAEFASSQVVNCAAAYRRQDIAVIVDLHFWSPEPEATMDKVIGNSVSLQMYANAVAALAVKLREWPHKSVALELLNEPRPCDGRFVFDWRVIQSNLLARVREVSAQLPVVVTGCGGQLDGLLNLDVTGLVSDENLIYSFHFYDPFIFTHQGTYYGSSFDSLRYPNIAIDTQLAVARALEIDIQEKTLTSARKEATLRDISNYLRRGFAADAIAARFEQVAHWAKKNNIPANRVFLGEFGAAIGLKPKNGATIFDDSVSWIRDVRLSADKYGFAYTWWIFPRPHNWTASPKNRFIQSNVVVALGLNNIDVE